MPKGIALVAYFLVCANCFAQQYPFIQYTPKDGLVNSRVRKAFQDSEGRMYFLTYGGLSVYDGTKFRNYTIRNGLAADLVNDILQISNDSLLVATNITSVNVLVKGNIYSLKTGDGFCPLVNQFYRHNGKEIYVSSDYGLFQMNDKKFRKLNITPITSDSSRLPSLGAITGFGNYLVIASNDLRSNQGLYLYDILADKICDAFPDKIIINVAKDKNNRVWVSLPDKLYMLDSAALSRGRLSLIAPTGVYRNTENTYVSNLAFDETGLWLLRENRALMHIRENGETSSIPLPAIITSSGIRSLLIDRENTLWICSDGAGVFKLINFQLQIQESPAQKNLPGFTWKATFFGDTTWYSTHTNKLFRQSPAGLNEFASNIEKTGTVFFQSGKKILIHDLRNIYEGTVTQAQTIQFRKIISLPGNDNFGSKLLVDPGGNIIAAMRSGIGVWSGSRLIFHLPISDLDLVEELVFDKRELLWVITRSEVARAFGLHPENPAHYLQLAYQFPRHSAKNSPRSFVIDKTGLLWIGTRDNGLSAFMVEGSQPLAVHHFDTGNGLVDNFVTALACDSAGNIIVGTQTGIDRLVKDTSNSYRVENLTKSSNFFSYITQVWTNRQNGIFGLTSTGRFLQLSPMQSSTGSLPPDLLIEEIKVNAIPLLETKNVFSHRENNVSFSVAAPSFIDENQISFAYLLEGAGSKQWSDTTPANATINLIGLAAGSYLLRVKAFFPSTSYKPAELSYAFEIKPPWWQTWWLRGIAGLLFIGVLVVVTRFYYRRKLEKQRIILERQQAIERERTRIASDMHDDLGAGLSRIKFLSETIGLKKQKKEPIEEDIGKIREYSHEMIDKMGEIVWALNERNDSLSDLLSYTRSYAVEYLSQHGIECTVNIPDFLPSTFVSGEFRRNVFLAVKEILHNVVKHARAGRVLITMQIGHHLSIEIRDDGVGFDREQVRTYSNGLGNIEKRMKDIGGYTTIQTGEGTTVRLEAPLPP